MVGVAGGASPTDARTATATSSAAEAGTFTTSVSQDTPGVAGTVEDADNFGIKPAAGDLDEDGRDDLVAGTPSEAIGTLDRAGSVTVLTSGPDGLLDASGTARSAAWHQDSAGVPGAPEVNDEFGSALALGDHDGDGPAVRAAGGAVLRAGTRALRLRALPAFLPDSCPFPRVCGSQLKMSKRSRGEPSSVGRGRRIGSGSG
ncbi:hypothetical protein GCM10009837_81580 [Streptomyces durmitorensis]|uniref:FG-GAP repeat-containing protein n=1 Tax=Streptomyces durmitorensis TaxID=319947 RepID=A0ABY4Q510_9ACTN|nr:FG-GAP repeat protein [Streptomyces durmitorensis]UQT61157.1 hypothetical protein M4V62_42180 [Streptomyces durmitorensis]